MVNDKNGRYISGTFSLGYWEMIIFIGIVIITIVFFIIRNAKLKAK